MTIYYSNKKNNHLKAIYLLIYQVYIYIGIEEDILSKRIYGKKMCIQRWWISFYIYKVVANNKSRIFFFFFFFLHFCTSTVQEFTFNMDKALPSLLSCQNISQEYCHNGYKFAMFHDQMIYNWKDQFRNILHLLR